MIIAYCLGVISLLTSVHFLQVAHANWRAKKPYQFHRITALLNLAATLLIAEYCWGWAIAITLVALVYGFVVLLYIMAFNAKTSR